MSFQEDKTCTEIMAISTLAEEEKEKYLTDTKKTHGRDILHLNLDLNDDGVDEIVIQSVGQGGKLGPDIHTLIVYTTSGSRYSYEFHPFELIKFQTNIYLVEKFSHTNGAQVRVIDIENNYTQDPTKPVCNTQ